MSVSRTRNVVHKNTATTGNVQRLVRNAAKVRRALACLITVLFVSVQRDTLDQPSQNVDQNAMEMLTAPDQGQPVIMASVRTHVMELVVSTLIAISVD